MRVQESIVEDAALTWFKDLGCSVAHWQDIPEDFKNKRGLKPGLVLV
jgi:hypothetical protein